MVESESEKEDVYAVDDASLDADGDVLPDATQENADDEREDEFIKVNKLLRKEVGSQAFNYVTRLHKSLGHPSGETLLRMLEEVQATEAVNTAAKKYVCPESNVLCPTTSSTWCSSSSWSDRQEFR